MKIKKQDQEQRRNKAFLLINDNKVQCKDVLEATGEKVRRSPSGK